MEICFVAESPANTRETKVVISMSHAIVPFLRSPGLYPFFILDKRVLSLAQIGQPDLR